MSVVPMAAPTPAPGPCRNGGVLGSGADLRVMLLTRGARSLVTEVSGAVSGSFTRVRVDTSELRMQCNIGGRPDAPDCGPWAEARPWAHEILVMRDGRDAWCGPITEIALGVEKVDVVGADPTAWYDRRRVPDLAFTGADPVDIVAALHEAAMAPDPIDNFLLDLHPTSIRTDRTYDGAEHEYVSDAIKELADTYIDWTMFSRTLIVTGDDAFAADGYLLITDEMWSTPPTIKERGNEQATRVVVKGKDGLVGVATAPQSYIDFYGLLERVFEETALEDQASVDASAQARLAVLMEPLYIEPPSGATLVPSAPIRFDLLIPGITVRVQSTATCRTIVADFRLAKVTAGFDGKVTVDLEPLGSVASTSTGG